MADTITNIVTHTITNTIELTNTITNTVINVLDKIDIVDITQPIAWYKNFTFWGTVVSIVTSIATVCIGWKVYKNWRIDKVIQMHTNLKNQKYIYYDKLDTKCKEECKEVTIGYAVDYLNELELIADMVLRGDIDFELAQEHFKTFYQIIGDKAWYGIINEQKEEDKNAYRKLLELAEKFEYKQYKNDKEK